MNPMVHDIGSVRTNKYESDGECYQICERKIETEGERVRDRSRETEGEKDRGREIERARLRERERGVGRLTTSPVTEGSRRR